jgi:hypothetical protein
MGLTTLPPSVSRLCQSQSYITTDSQSASPSWCQAPIWELRPIFPILFDCLLMWGALSDDKSGLYFSIFCRASPAQPFSYLSPTGLMSIFYCLYFWDSLNPEGQVPREQGSPLYSRALGFYFTFFSICLIQCFSWCLHSFCSYLLPILQTLCKLSYGNSKMCVLKACLTRRVHQGGMGRSALL